MYDAKAAGRDAFRVYRPGVRVATGDLDVAARLRRAIAENELTLRYQPIVDLSSGELTGVEALARWGRPRGAAWWAPRRVHPRGGAHRPDPAAE